MFRAEDLDFDIERLTIDAFGLLMLTSGCVKDGEGCAGLRRLRSAFPVPVLPDGQRFLSSLLSSAYRCCPSSRAPMTARSPAAPLEAGPSPNICKLRDRRACGSPSTNRFWAWSSLARLCNRFASRGSSGPRCASARAW